MWKGTAEILKPKPTSRSANPMSRSGSREAPAVTAAPILLRFVEPVAP